jgi:ABC-type dipeptide/oligopeptide/nickel transport system permease component
MSLASMWVSPGDPVDLFTYNHKMTCETRLTLRHQRCLDRPIAVEYLICMFGNEECYTKGIMRLDFGGSLFEKHLVLEMIFGCIPASVELAGLALAAGMLTDILAGIYSAVRHDSISD